MVSNKLSAVPMILAAGLSIEYWGHVQHILIGLAVPVLVKIAIRLVRFMGSVALHFSFRGIDSMDGIEFERYIADLLRKRGYCNVALTERYD